eukprot:35039-Amphidinium_carterae.2
MQVDTESELRKEESVGGQQLVRVVQLTEGPAAPRPTTAPATKAMAEVKGEDAAVPTAGDDATAEDQS